jgi:hypothetical protein
MAVETSLFTQIIEEHLDLKRRNSDLESALPIDRYKSGDPFENHPLFKTEEQARLEETMDGSEPAVTAHAMHRPGEERAAERSVNESEDGLWGRSRDFDWGD